MGECGGMECTVASKAAGRKAVRVRLSPLARKKGKACATPSKDWKVLATVRIDGSIDKTEAVARRAAQLVLDTLGKMRKVK